MKSFPHTKSRLKECLKTKELTTGSWITIPHQAVVEIMGTAGFDWLTIDIEHSAIDLQTAQNLISHIQANGMEALVRVSANDEVIIKRVMDAGASGVIVPMIKSAAEAKKAVSFVKYPNKGARGVGLSRAQHYGTGFESYLEWVNNESVVIAQIEHISAVHDLENILDVDGIDGIIVGPYDLSASMGKPGEFEDKEVKKALAQITHIAKTKSKSLGFHVIQPDHMEMLKKRDQGYSFLSFSLDFFFLGNKVREEMKKLKTAL